MRKSLMAKLFSLILACTLLVGNLSFPAYAYAEDTDQNLPSSETNSSETVPSETPSATEPSVPNNTQPTEEEDKGGGFTRDLLYDKATNKQFITVETKNGNIFYIIIDYDAPIDEDEEQYQTYFLNKVDEQDLAALIEEGGMTVITCDCGTRCEVGSIDTSCPVCKTNMADCTGKSPEQPSEPSATEPTQPQEKPESNIGSLLTIGALALVGIGAYYYFKFGKGKKVDEDMDFYDDEGYEEEAYINEDAEPQIAEDEEAEMDGDLY